MSRLVSAFPTSVGSPANLSPAAVHALPAALRQAYLEAFSGSMHWVFLVACMVSAVAFALSWLLQEVPLRKA